MANKKRLSFIIALALLAIIPACAQRSSSSEHSFHKAVEAYYEDDDQNKALELVNKILDDNPDHLDARYLRSNIYWNNDKYVAAICDVTYAIKNYKGEPEWITSAAAFALDEIMPPYCFMTVLYASGSRELDSSHFRRGRVDSPNMFPR